MTRFKAIYASFWGCAGVCLLTIGACGQGDSCHEQVTHDLIQRTLAEYCAHHDCPSTLAEARADVVTDCRGASFTEEITGCGRTVVKQDAGVFGRGYVFEGSELVGAYSFRDLGEPPCNTVGEFGGLYPPNCPSAETCRHCDHGDGAGDEVPFCSGFGGQGGQGGEGGSGN